MSDVMLECRDVSIRYMVGDFKNIGLKEWFSRRIMGKYQVKEFWADRHVSFKLERGDMLGIIGTNGAGKSTILKAISGIMLPTEGRVIRKGKVSALLELASGFDADLNVKENAYLRGAMLGYTRAFMDKTYAQIVDFAELKDFEDRPFKQLSSGMKSRLAFAIASLVRPEILILDEVLAVGDGAFRAKSEAKMREIISGGATTILVSHSLPQIRQMCNKILWLEKGRQIAFGDDVKGICNLYEGYLKKRFTLDQLDNSGGRLRVLRSPAEKVCELRKVIRDSLTPLVTGDYHLLAAPHIRNVGDHLIYQGEVDFLKTFDYACKSVHSIQTFTFPKMAKNEVIFIHGGGFIGDAWGGGTLRVLNRVISRYPDNSIVIFPQSTCFTSKEFLAETEAVWSKHKRLTVCARDRVSFDFLKTNFPKNTVLLVPDMAFYADLEKWVSHAPSVADKPLLFMRWDCETKDRLALAKLQQNLRCEARDWPTISGDNVDFLEIRRLAREKKYAEADKCFQEKLHPHCMREGIRFLEPYRDIYTTRLHGLILAVLMNKPSVTFLDNSYGKLSSFYQTWLDDVKGVFAVTNDVEPARSNVEAPDVTVIIAAHKRPDTLRVALESVYAQKQVNLEVVVINGVPEPDPVDDVVKKHPSCIYIKDEKYLTLSAKHELGLGLASARLVHFLDDDDYLTDPLFFRKAVDVMKDHPDLAFVSGGCERRVEGPDHETYRMVDHPNQVDGLIAGEKLFQGLQITIRKPISTATVFRKTALTSGEPLFEVSDSSLFLKALLNGPAYVISDKVAVYRVWSEQMTHGRGSDFAFKLNVMRQKEALYRQAVGKISDPLDWWSKTFQMNFNYFEKKANASPEDRKRLAQWGLEHAHESAELTAFCRVKLAEAETASGGTDSADTKEGVCC